MNQGLSTREAARVELVRKDVHDDEELQRALLRALELSETATHNGGS